MAQEIHHWKVNLPLEAEQRRETFARFGLASYHAQCVERQLAILIATTYNPAFLKTSPDERDQFFDKEFTKTMGQLLKTVRSRTQIDKEFESRLSKGLELRNWLIHRYFWERASFLLTWEGRESMISELQDASQSLSALDTELTSITENWLQQCGISQERLAVLLEEYKQSVGGKQPLER